MTLSHLPSLSWPWWITESCNAVTHTLKRKKKISILVLCRGCRMHYNSCQYLQCVGNAGIWRLLSVVGYNPAVRERRGSFQARIFTKQDDYVRNRLWRSQRGKVTHKRTHRSTTHILCCGFLVIFCLQIKELGLSCFKCCKRQREEVTHRFSRSKSELAWQTIIFEYEHYLKKTLKSLLYTALV